MNCCTKCFTSLYLCGIINSDTRKGDCDFCSSKDVSIYTPRELIPFFRNILNLYDVENDKGKDLVSSLKLDFGDTIFSELEYDKSSLIKAIIEEEADDFGPLLENKVTSAIPNGNLQLQLSEVHNVWGKFKNEIKNINRFHIQNTVDLKKLKSFFDNESFHTQLIKGRIFYRSRISDNLGYPKEKMGSPPCDKAIAGRANPKGISYLYLSDDMKTTLYETRASLFDYVTIGEFRLLEDIKVLNLREPSSDPISWAEQEAIEDYLVYVPFIKTLQRELSLPIRKLDKEIDYLPTQYLSEFIKSIGFDGVEFQSSLFSDGYNLAIFNPENFECIKTSIHEIESIEIKNKKLQVPEI